MFQNLLLVGLGGFMGALLRYSITGFFQGWSKSVHFPYGTLVVNLLGCLLLGFLSQIAETRGIISAEARSFLFVGLLGAFTTFSTFGNDLLTWANAAFLGIRMGRTKLYILPFVQVFHNGRRRTSL